MSWSDDMDKVMAEHPEQFGMVLDDHGNPVDRVAPRTAAGKRLLNYLMRSVVTTDERRRLWLSDVLAIEAEAASLDHGELRKAVEALRPRAMKFTTLRRAGFEDGLNAVLALLAGDKAEAPLAPDEVCPL